MVRKVLAARLVPLLLLAGLAILLSGCEVFSSPQNTFAPEGTVAARQKDDFLLVMWPALAIMILVLGGVVFIALKFRRQSDDPGLPKQVHGNTPLELTWTILPAVLLAVIAVPTLTGITDLGRAPRADALQVTVVGQRFSWDFSYTGADGVDGEPLFAPPNELRIPVDREVGLDIRSIDVNHSFWVPKLAGKTDAIANHPNRMWIRGTKVGTYAGQCAEFCGENHSEMRFKVIVMEAAEFEAWLDEQRAAARGEGGVDTPAGVTAGGE